MAFNKNIATNTIVLKIRELASYKRAWAEEAQRLWDAQLAALEAGAEAAVSGAREKEMAAAAVVDALEEARLEAGAMAARYQDQIEELEAELDAMEAGPGYFRPHRK